MTRPDWPAWLDEYPRSMAVDELRTIVDTIADHADALDLAIDHADHDLEIAAIVQLHSLGEDLAGLCGAWRDRMTGGEEGENRAEDEQEGSEGEA